MGPVLAIESSCDETAAAVLAEDGTILAETVSSQAAAHTPFGGVVPEVAARAHVAAIAGLAQDVMLRAGTRFADLGGVAGSVGPGLIGGLIVGSQFAKGAALAQGRTFIAINHLEAHALTARLPGLFQAGGLDFPYLLLLVSGGHCQCLVVRGVGHYERLGGTTDDAAGEAYDKVAKLLGLGWPGGPAIERLAAEGDAAAYPFPRPLLGRIGCDFSFSGLKTAVAQEVMRYGAAVLPRGVAANIAASFQRAVTAVLVDRAMHAMTMFAARHGRGSLVVAGGVAANAQLRAALEDAASAHSFSLIVPPARYCTDNAVMVAWAAIERLRLGWIDGLDTAPRPRWPLDAADMRR